MTSTLMDRIRARMRSLRERDLYRTLRAPAGIDLSSNDYLGLATHPYVVTRMAAAAARDGAGSTGSRLLRGHRDLFTAVEDRFAAFKATERALYFSSGYLANVAVLTTFPEAGDVILSDERNHASLIDGIRLSSARREIFRHNDVDHVRHLLDSTKGAGQQFLVVESLFSMDGDRAPLAEYADLCRVTGASLIVDEAHAVGIFGPTGSGLIEASGAGSEVFLSINTAGKALGVSGAFAAGPAAAIEYVIQRARTFVFSTAPPPAVVAAVDASLDVVLQEPWRRVAVLEHAAELRARVREAGIAVPEGSSQILPLIVGENDRAVAIADTLRLDGFDVRAIRPPTVPAGSARLRISVNVTITSEIIGRFMASLTRALAVTGTRCFAGSS